MKTFKFILSAVMMATTCFLSCTEDEMVVADSPCQQTITADIAEPAEAQQSRSCVDVQTSCTEYVGLLWQPSDTIGVFSDSETTGNVPFTNTATANVAKAEFGGTMSGTPSYAYFPYSEANNGQLVTSLKGSVLTEQPYNPENGSLVCDYKYGVPVSGSTNQFTFNQLFTLLRITIDATDTDLVGDKLESISLKVTDAEGIARNICGEFTFNATNGEWTAGTQLSNTVTMPWTNKPVLAKDQTLQGFITVMPDVQKDDKISIEVRTAGYKVSFTASSLLNFEAGYVYNIPLTLNEYAKNSDSFGYVVEKIVDPTISAFEFKVADNTGKLLDNKLVWNTSSNSSSFTSVSTHSATINDESGEITLTIPYLYNFTLVPTFTFPTGCTVTVDGVEQESGTIEVDFTKPVVYTVSNSTGQSRNYTVKVTNTGLPVVVVKHSSSGDYDNEYKGGVEIFGNNIGGTLTNKFVDFMIRGKETEWVTDDQIIVYNSDGTVDCSATGGVRLRGNTTRTYPKKPLAIKLNSKASVLGMPAHKRWVLLANQLDHSMIRNTIAFDIAHLVESAWRQNSSIEQGIPWCPSGQNVELIVVDKDGDAHHVGNYFLGEQIKIDENRLNILEPLDIDEEPSASDYTQYGYLIEGVTSDKRDETSYFTSDNGIIFQFKDELNSTILNQVKEKMNRIEKNIVDGNYSTAYEELDIHSLIDQMLIWELTLNREYGDPSSVYMYLDGAGKLSAGPVWDFDRGTFQNQELASAGSNANTSRVKPDNEWMYWRKSSDESYIWYSQLAADATFQQVVKERWAVIYPYLQEVEGIIRSYGSTLKASWDCNNAMWPTTRSAILSFKSDFTDWSGDEELATFDEVISNFITVYNERLAGMNTLITNGTFTNE